MIKDYLPSDERDLLHRLVESEGWKHFNSVHQTQLKQSESQLLSEQCPTRDWVSGYVAAYRRLLGWPGTRIKTLDEKLSTPKR